MSNAMKAAEDLKLLANRLRPLFEVGSALESIGSLEQAARDAGIAKDKAYAEAEKAKAELEAVKKQVEKAKADCNAAVSEAESVADEANKKAFNVVNEANLKVSSLVNAASEKVKSFEKEISMKRFELNAVVADIEVKKQEFEVLKKQIQDVKAKVAAFVGA